jgi:hypothetical protein
MHNEDKPRKNKNHVPTVFVSLVRGMQSGCVHAQGLGAVLCEDWMFCNLTMIASILTLCEAKHGAIGNKNPQKL